MNDSGQVLTKFKLEILTLNKQSFTFPKIISQSCMKPIVVTVQSSSKLLKLI